jgi:hypothetical protein
MTLVTRHPNRHRSMAMRVSQRENLDDRATHRADKIRDQLKWEPGILNRDFLIEI